METELHQNTQKFPRRTAFLNLVLLPVFLAAGFLIYFPSLKADFVFDDLNTLEQNPFIKVWELKRFFLNPGTFSAKIGNSPYRPLVALSYALDYKLGKGNWAALHATNILLHALSGFFLFLCAQALFKSRRAGLIAGALFLVHPLPGFSANYLSARSGIMCSLFLLVSLFLWARSKDSHNFPSRAAQYGLHLGFFGLALLCKIDAVVLIPIIFALSFFRDRDWKWQSLARDILPLLVLGGGFLALYKYLAGSPFVPTQSSMTPLYSRSDSLLAAMLSPAIYFLKTLMPVRLSIFPGLPGHALTLAVLAIICYLAVAGAALYRRNAKALLVLIWYFSALLPVLFLRLNILLAYYRGYLALAGLFMGLGLAVDYLLKHNRRLALPIVLSAILFAGLAHAQSRDWISPRGLWSSAIKQSPSEFVPHHFLAVILIQDRELDRADRELNWTLRLRPDFADAHNSLGVLMFRQGQSERGRAELDRAWRLDPENYVYLENLIMARLQLRELDGMGALLEQLLKIAPPSDTQAQKLQELYLKIQAENFSSTEP